MTDQPPDRLDGPLDHILREPLPWRTSRLTECGRPAVGLPLVSPEDLAARVTRLGKMRAAFTVCMTCADRCGYNQTVSWATHPVTLLERELTRVRTGYGPKVERARAELVRELHAINALIAAHRDEFDALVTGNADLTRLDDRRHPRRARG
jgi:hypothetical protein